MIKKSKTKKVSLRSQIKERYFDEKIDFIPDFDDAILGIEEDNMRVIYSGKIVSKMKNKTFPENTENILINDTLGKIDVVKKISELYPKDKCWIADGFDKAIIGVDVKSKRVVYSSKKAIHIIYKEIDLKKSDLTEEEITDGITLRERKMEMALEDFYYNVSGSKGEGFPIWLTNDFE